MERDSTLYGRNPLREALRRRVQIDKIFVKGPSDQVFVESLLKELRLSSIPIRQGLPPSVVNEAHQGVAFQFRHEFYLPDARDISAERYPKILLCNHLQDIQNLGALSRSAAAFGFHLIAHEKRRSFRVNAAAVKVSMGLAFHLQYIEVSNLVPLCQRLKKMGYLIAGLEAESPTNLFEWQPSAPMALVLGSEAEGISRPLEKLIDDKIRIAMSDSVDSLNVVQAGSVAMSWVHYRLNEFSVAQDKRTN